MNIIFSFFREWIHDTRLRIMREEKEGEERKESRKRKIKIQKYSYRNNPSYRKHEKRYSHRRK